MDTTSSNGGSPEPVPTPIPPCEPASSDGTGGVAAEADAAPTESAIQVDVQPVTPSTLPVTDRLSAPQQAALAVLVSGGSPGAAARAAGVVASTLHRWRTKDPWFIGALNAWRNQAQELARDRVLGMAGQAVATVLASMQKGDARTALAILKGLGAITPAAKGPVGVVDVRRAIDRDRYREYLDVQRERVLQRGESVLVMHHGFGKGLTEEDRKQAKLDGIDVDE